jgi:hypothetical protein
MPLIQWHHPQPFAQTQPLLLMMMMMTLVLMVLLLLTPLPTL